MKRAHLIHLLHAFAVGAMLVAPGMATGKTLRHDVSQEKSGATTRGGPVSASRWLPPELRPPGGMPHLDLSNNSWFLRSDRARARAAMFSKNAAYSSGGAAPTSIAVADVNGDGKPDEIVLNECTSGNNGNCSGPGVVSVLLGNGDGTFQKAVTYTSGGYDATQVLVADLNGDGIPDLIVLNTCADALCTMSPDGGLVGVLFGNGDGTFRAGASVPTGYYPSSIAAADLNHDGRIDLAVSFYCSARADQCSYGAVDIFLGNGDGTFRAPLDFNSRGYVTEEVVVADMNGDGYPDLAVANCGGSNCYVGTVGVLLGNGDGTFQSAQTYNSGGVLALALTTGDVNGDGIPDLVVDNDCLSPNRCNGAAVGVLIGNGDGTLQPAVTYPAGGYGCSNSGYCPVSIALSDINRDGTLDVVAPFNILPGNGDGTFQAPITYSSDSCRRGKFAVADLNLDGKPDISIANYYSRNGCSSTGLTILMNVDTAPTTTTLVSSSNPAFVMQTVTYTATIASRYVGGITGNVEFKDGGTTLGWAGVVNGQATLSTSFNSAGTRFITATYTGDANNSMSASAALQQAVHKWSTATTISSSANPSTYGQSVTFTATIFANGEATGTVTLRSGTVALGTVQVAGNAATFSTSTLTTGAHVITAFYSGDSTFVQSTSAGLKQVVNSGPSRRTGRN